MGRERDAFDMFDEPERGRFGENEDRRAAPRVNGASDLVDVTVFLQLEKEKAIAVSDGPQAKWVWLPKSQIEFEMRPKGCVTVTLPEWLAKNKGLL